MSCPEVTIPVINQELYTKLLEHANAAGAKFEGETVTIDGITLNWLYDAPTQTLHLTCVKKPFYVSCGELENKLRELVDKAAKEEL